MSLPLINALNLSNITHPAMLNTLLQGAAMGTMLIALSASLVACDNGRANNGKIADKTADKTTLTSPTTPSGNAASSLTDTKSDTKLLETLSQNMQKSGLNIKPISAVATDMPNIYRIKAEGMSPFLADATGQYVFQGEMIKVGGAKPVSITHDLMAADAKAALAGVDKKDMAIFPATGATKAAIYVFTDADCGYCRKLHSEIQQINAKGIEVRYLPWPRSEASLPIMQKVWCSKDRTTALTKATNDVVFDAPPCDNPVAKLHDMGAGIGVSGTPAIFTQEGQQIGGYMPPDELAKALNIQ